MMRRTTVFGLSVAGLIFSVVAAATIGNAYAGQTTRVSVSSAGVLADTGATNGVLSADGNYVVFQSSASNLHPRANGLQQVYRHDRTTGATVLVSATASGDPGNNVSRDPSVSANGDYVVFSSFATDLVASDTNGAVMDVFRRDMRTGATAVVSTSSTGAQGDLGSGLSGLPGAREISDLGQFVVFTSFATNLVAGANTSQQVYVKDMVTQEVVRASVNNDGDAGNAVSERPAISGNGEVVAFSSTSTNLSPIPTFGYAQVFVHELGSRTTSLESVATSGLPQFARHSNAPALSSDGRYVAFESQAVLHADDLDNGTLDVYLRDRVAPGSTVLASLSNNMLSGAHSIQASISADGRWVGFASFEDLPAAGDTRRQYDVYVYDRTSPAVTLVALNDDGVQANMQSLGPSLSNDGGLILFVSAASNLVAEPSNGFMQLYVRRLVSSVPPSVNLPSTLDVAFSTLDMPGTFTDPDANETYLATVNYGDGSGAQELALAGASFQLDHVYASPGTYPVVVTVTDSNGGEGSATLAVSVLGYSYEWLDPIGSSFTVGRNLPVKFQVRGPNGASVLDETVRVDVIDASGTVLVGYVFGDQPSRSVTWGNDTYHVNVDTRDLEAGMYWLRVRFSSPTLTGEFTLATNGLVDAARARIR